MGAPEGPSFIYVGTQADIDAADAAAYHELETEINVGAELVESTVKIDAEPAIGRVAVAQ